MISRTRKPFLDLYRALPKDIRKQAREAFRQFKQNPAHNSLKFKKVHASKPLYSARVNDNYRVLGILHDDTIIWFWIGTHTEYERMISRF